MRDGKLQYGSVLPETKEALRAVQNMYKNGWLDQEFFVKDFTQAKEAVTNGKVGVVMGYHWLPLDVLNPMHEKFPDVEWDCYPWPTAAAGVPATVMMQSSLSSALVVSTEFAHPEVAVQMVNLYCEKLYDPEKSDYNYWGDDFEKGVQGVGQLGPLYIIHPNLNLDPYRDIMKVYRGEMTVDQMNSASKHYYDAVNSIWAWNVMWGTGEHTTGTVLDFLVSNPQYMIQNAYVGTPTETQAERGGSLEEIRNTAFSQIMTGKLDVDAGFDKFVQDYMAAGGQDIEDEVNAWYQANQQ
jgi:putative aldouronate transport system substrate-binding protein